jgi:hypothetical protein
MADIQAGGRPIASCSKTLIAAPRFSRPTLSSAIIFEISTQAVYQRNCAAPSKKNGQFELCETETETIPTKRMRSMQAADRPQSRRRPRMVPSVVTARSLQCEPATRQLPSGRLIGNTTPRQVHGHDDQPALNLREGMRRVFRNHHIIAFANSLWCSALDF